MPRQKSRRPQRSAFEQQILDGIQSRMTSSSAISELVCVRRLPGSGEFQAIYVIDAMDDDEKQERALSRLWRRIEKALELEFDGDGEVETLGVRYIQWGLA